MTMEKISEAILGKAKAEAEEIIREAEAKAGERIESAREQFNTRLGAEKARLVEAAESEVARIQAQASIKIRQELLKAKNEIIKEITGRTKKRLGSIPGSSGLAVNQIREGIEAIGSDGVIVYVSPGDFTEVKNILKKDRELSAKIREIRERDISGGAVVEDAEGRFSIDNSWDTRLETLLPRILPEISKELFGT